MLSDKGSSVDAMKFPEVDGSSADEMKPSKSLSADGLRSLALKLISPVCSDDPQINTFEDATVVPSTPRGVELTPRFSLLLDKSKSPMANSSRALVRMDLAFDKMVEEYFEELVSEDEIEEGQMELLQLVAFEGSDKGLSVSTSV